MPRLGVRPNAILPSGKEPGFAVPDELRSRWHLELGMSQEILPRLLENLGMIDVFFHDSEHTYENMMFECEQAWPHLNEQGVMLLDDVQSNNAFKDFSATVRRKPLVIPFLELGILLK